ncbi:MAG: SAF domain-containing protein [Acidimicrobiales bacterium]
MFTGSFGAPLRARRTHSGAAFTSLGVLGGGRGLVGSPAGRAALGGLLVASSAIGLFVLANQSQESGGRYVVASRDLAAGTPLSTGDLSLVPMSLAAPTQARAFTDPAALIGSRLAGPVGRGELVQAAAIGPAGVAERELSFRIDAGEAAEGLSPGDQVDVLSTFGSGEGAVSAVVAEGVNITAVDPGTRGGIDGSAMVTVALANQHDSLALAHALALGRTTVVRTGRPGLELPAESAGAGAGAVLYRGPSTSGAARVGGVPGVGSPAGSGTAGGTETDTP